MTTTQDIPAPATWTVERVQRLRTLWDSGLSASQVGDDLGITRNAVIGKLGRLGLTGVRSLLLAKQRAAKIEASGQRKPRKTHLKLRMLHAGPEKTDLAPDVSPCPVPFLERRTTQCAWPLWTDATPVSERMVCGAKAVPECSWCGRHLLIVARRRAS